MTSTATPASYPLPAGEVRIGSRLASGVRVTHTVEYAASGEVVLELSDGSRARYGVADEVLLAAPVARTPRPVAQLVAAFLDHPEWYVGATLMLRMPAGWMVEADGTVAGPTPWVDAVVIDTADCLGGNAEQGVCEDCLADYLGDYEVRLAAPLPSAYYGT